jgi:hypothetical protein
MAVGAFLRLVVTFLALGQHAVLGRLFGGRAGWLRPSGLGKQEETPIVTQRCFTLRGGAKEKVADGEKVKGVCIGIDLGTTTRYASRSTVSDSFF